MVTIVGAGFAGLTLGYELDRLGVEFEILERQSTVGGRLQTLFTAEGLIETAANALLNDPWVEELFRDLGLARAERLPTARRRYIYWDRPRRWPLSKTTSARLFWQLARIKTGANSLKPRAGESVRTWGERLVNAEFVDRLIAPGLRGVYAGEPERLSANLTLGALFGRKRPRAKVRGSVAPALGMGALCAALRDRLGARLRHLEFRMVERSQAPLVLCVSAWEASAILRPSYTEIADRLGRVESLDLTSTTLFFGPRPDELPGFGCLFPAKQDFNSLGVLFNSDIFAGRGPFRSETWIGRGVDGTDESLLNAIAKDRRRLVGREDTSKGHVITRWPRAIPYYTLEWEKELASLSVPPPLYLHGNYLGRLGLAQILGRSKKLAAQIKETHGTR